MRKLSRIDENLFHKSVEREYTGKEKKQDCVNNMSMEDLFEYIKSHYEYVNDIHKEIMNSRNIITIPICTNDTKHYFSIHVFFNGDGIAKIGLHVPEKCLNILDDRFKIIQGLSIAPIVCPKEGELDNEFLIDLIDQFCEKAEFPVLRKKINEELFHSSVRREYTGETRKEDDVNNLEMQGFYEYLIKHYGPSVEGDKKMLIYHSDVDKLISVTIMYHEGNPLRLSVGTEFLRINYKILELYPNIFDGTDITMDDEGMGKLFPEGSREIDNKFVIKVIDHLLDNVDDPVIKKIHK